jgi:acyl-CoA hydrolase
MPDSEPSVGAPWLVEMTELVLPEDTNTWGTIFGGRVLALVDKCAAIGAMRHTRTPVLTVAMDSVEFRNPVQLGDVLILRARLNAVFGSSMEVEVEVHSENPRTGERNLTTTAFVTMVSVDPRGRPTAAPPLAVGSPADQERAAQATERRRVRLRRKLDS